MVGPSKLYWYFCITGIWQWNNNKETFLNLIMICAWLFQIFSFKVSHFFSSMLTFFKNYWIKKSYCIHSNYNFKGHIILIGILNISQVLVRVNMRSSHLYVYTHVSTINSRTQTLSNRCSIYCIDPLIVFGLAISLVQHQSHWWYQT